MRILHVSSSYPRTEGDATAPFMEEMTVALAERGHDVRVVVPNVAGLQTGTRNGVDVVAFRHAPHRWETWGFGQSLQADGRLRRASVLATPLVMTAMLATVRTQIARWVPDAVHLHWLVPQGALGPMLGRSVPVVLSLHGADVAVAGRSTLFRAVARRALQRADRVVAASSGMFDEVASLSPTLSSRAEIIPHGANAGLFGKVDRPSARRALGVDLDSPLLLAVGRLVDKKGFDRLILAMRNLQVENVRLVIAGEGPGRARLAELADATSGVTLLGEVSRRSLASWFAAADLVVIPSRSDVDDIDSGPVVLVESLASGRGVVSTPVGMAPDLIVDGENGFLVPESEPRALADAIARGLPIAERLGEGAHATFDRSGDWGRVAEQLESVYEAAIAHRRAV